MTRKDYVAIAEAIREVLRTRGSADDPDVEYALHDVAEAVASVCAIDNPRFDRARFLKACGI